MRCAGCAFPAWLPPVVSPLLWLRLQAEVMLAAARKTPRPYGTMLDAERRPPRERRARDSSPRNRRTRRLRALAGAALRVLSVQWGDRNAASFRRRLRATHNRHR